MRLRLLAAATLLAGSLMAADPELLSLAAPDSQVIAGINVERALLSPLGQFGVAQATQASGNDLQKMIELTGFDPRRDLREILISAKGQPGNGSVLMLARGAFDIPKIMAGIPGGGTAVTYKGVSILQPSKTQALAFPDSTLAIFGEPADVNAAIDRKTAPTSINSALAVEVNRVSATEDAWFVSTTPISKLQPTPTSGPNPLAMLSKVQQAIGGVTFGANVVVSLQAVSETAQDASTLAMLLKAAGIGLSGNSDLQATTAAELLKSLNVTSDGPVTKISWSMPESQIEQMIQATHPNNGTTHESTVPPQMRPAPHAELRAETGPAAQRLRVSGEVQKAKLVQQTAAEYPPLAKQARISGTVRMAAIIGKDGAVQEVRLVSGHPLLAQAAMDAVKQWVYKPTLLNGKAVEIATQIEVNFALEQ